MSIFNATYNQKKNKKIKFEEFPGDKTGENKELDTGKKSKKKILIIIIVIILIILLSLSATYINSYILEEKSTKYKKVVSLKDEQYAKIEEENRKSTFKDIGFDDFTVYDITENDNSYIINEASNEVDSDLSEQESIRIKYDENSIVNLVELKLIFKKEDLNIDNIYENCSTVISNFTSVEIKKDFLNRLLNGIKLVKADNVTYERKNLEKNYTMIIITIEK